MAEKAPVKPEDKTLLIFFLHYMQRRRKTGKIVAFFLYLSHLLNRQSAIVNLKHPKTGTAKTTDLWSFNTGRVQAKMGVNHKMIPEEKLPVSFVILDNHQLTGW